MHTSCTLDRAVTICIGATALAANIMAVEMHMREFYRPGTYTRTELLLAAIYGAIYNGILLSRPV